MDSQPKAFTTQVLYEVPCKFQVVREIFLPYTDRPFYKNYFLRFRKGLNIVEIHLYPLGVSSNKRQLSFWLRMHF